MISWTLLMGRCEAGRGHNTGLLAKDRHVNDFVKFTVGVQALKY